MTSAAQVEANRSNAQKSTGPRTPEGKAVAAQNAVRHGLLAQEVVVKGEDPGEFELYRQQMLAELAPVGALEEMLAQRIVGLSWRLRRAERLQAKAYDKIETKSEPAEPTMSYEDASWLLARMVERGMTYQAPPGPPPGHRAVLDFNQERVLDRLLMYERRIEHSLYRTMAELRKERLLRSTGILPVSSMGAGSQTRDSAFGVPVPPMNENQIHRQACPEFVEGKDCDIHGQDARATHGRDGNPKRDESRLGIRTHATEPEGGSPNEACETNPIGAGAPDGAVPGGAEDMSALAPGEIRQTKPTQGPGATPNNTPSRPRRLRKYPNTVKEETYDSHLGRWVWTGHAFANKDANPADAGRRR